MGLIQSVYNHFFSNIKDARILMVGLDNAGKTTILYKLQLGEVQHTIPTIGFNVEMVEMKNFRLSVWDIGGQEKIRSLWRFYYEGTNAIIFVVDSMDTSRYELAKMEISRLLSTVELQGVPILVYANKQDLAGPDCGPQAVMSKLGLNEVRDRPWFCQGCSGVAGSGLYEGLDWLTTQLKAQGR